MLIAFLIAVLFYFQIINGLLGVLFLVFAIVILVPSLFRFSILYKLFGIDTTNL
ncbi:DUF2892 domain-containing protein [Galbibacter mesophilus]|nr:DUF2892 domain-containing protein [Galbibacter mesophilus]